MRATHSLSSATDFNHRHNLYTEWKIMGTCTNIFTAVFSFFIHRREFLQFFRSIAYIMLDDILIRHINCARQLLNLNIFTVLKLFVPIYRYFKQCALMQLWKVIYKFKLTYIFLCLFLLYHLSSNKSFLCSQIDSAAVSFSNEITSILNKTRFS